jgi:hypothetical protein
VPALEVVVDETGRSRRSAVNLGDQGAREGGSPTLLEDGGLDPFDPAVRLRSLSANEAACGAAVLDSVGEGRGPKLGVPEASTASAIGRPRAVTQRRLHQLLPI